VDESEIAEAIDSKSFVLVGASPTKPTKGCGKARNALWSELTDSPVFLMAKWIKAKLAEAYG